MFTYLIRLETSCSRGSVKYINDMYFKYVYTIPFFLKINMILTFFYNKAKSFVVKLIPLDFLIKTFMVQIHNKKKKKKKRENKKWNVYEVE